MKHNGIRSKFRPPIQGVPLQGEEARACGPQAPPALPLEPCPAPMDYPAALEETAFQLINLAPVAGTSANLPTPSAGPPLAAPPVDISDRLVAVQELPYPFQACYQWAYFNRVQSDCFTLVRARGAEWHFATHRCWSARLPCPTRPRLTLPGVRDGRKLCRGGPHGEWQDGRGGAGHLAHAPPLPHAVWGPPAPAGPDQGRLRGPDAGLGPGEDAELGDPLQGPRHQSVRDDGRHGLCGQGRQRGRRHPDDPGEVRRRDA